MMKDNIKKHYIGYVFKNIKKIFKKNHINIKNIKLESLVYDFSKFVTSFDITYRMLNYHKLIYLINQKILNLILSTNKTNKKLFKIENLNNKKYKGFFFIIFNRSQRLCYVIKKLIF